MRFLIFIITTFLFCSYSNARIFRFEYQFPKGKAIIKADADSWAEAYELASQECFNLLTGAKNRDKIVLTETQIEEVLAICINPR